MTRQTRQKSNTYQSLELLPVWNYWKIEQTGNYKYMVALKPIEYDNFELNEKEKDSLQNTYVKMFDSFRKIDLSLQVAYYVAWEKYFMFLIDGKSIEANKAFTKYLEELNKHFDKFFLNEDEYSSATELYKELKTGLKIPYDEMCYLRLKIFDYTQIKATRKKNKWDLIKESIKLKEIINQNFNIYECSVLEYEHLKSLAVEKIKSSK